MQLERRSSVFYFLLPISWPRMVRQKVNLTIYYSSELCSREVCQTVTFYQNIHFIEFFGGVRFLFQMAHLSG